MSSKRVAMLDDAGKCVNVILIDDEAWPTNWYPGYGRYLVALEPLTPPSEPVHPTKMSYLSIVPQGTLAINDTMDLTTGAVTKAIPDVPPPPSKEELLAYAANKRWEVEVGGCVWNGQRVQTDRESQTKLIAEFISINAGLRTDPSPWKMATGNFVSLTNAQMTEVIVAVRSHVAGAFNVEAALQSEIQDGIVTTFADIEAANWP